MQWDKHKVLVIGLGLSGRSAARLLLQRGATVWGVDQRTETLKQEPDIQALRQEGLILTEQQTVNLSSFDLVVVSPGVPPTHPLYQEAFRQHIPLIGEIELALSMAPSSWRFLGVTGTNGKTTVTSLVAHVLSQQGIPAAAVGNIGAPLTDELLNPRDLVPVYVVELSSYQIETMHRRSLEAALILNITPDHLDRYGTMPLYALAKMRLSQNVRQPNRFFVQQQAWQEFGHLLSNQTPSSITFGHDLQADLHVESRTGAWIYQGQKLSPPTPKMPPRETENLMGAFLLCQTCGVSLDGFLHSLSSFTKPAHRIEFVTTYRGVSFYDDSKGTNLDAVIHAVETRSRPVVLIVGGIDKGVGYKAWIKAFHGRVKALVGIGQASPLIEKELGAHFPFVHCTQFEEAIRTAYTLAHSEADVLLSPGCASQDMFRDYKHRGEEFKRIIQLIVSTREP